jgi:hypothetical protein
LYEEQTCFFKPGFTFFFCLKKSSWSELLDIWTLLFSEFVTVGIVELLSNYMLFPDNFFVFW